MSSCVVSTFSMDRDISRLMPSSRRAGSTCTATGSGLNLPHISSLASARNTSAEKKNHSDWSRSAAMVMPP